MATRKTELTRLTLDNLMPAGPGRDCEIADTLVPGLRVRVADAAVEAGRFKGKAALITFVLVARFPPSTNPTRRALGRYDRDGGGVTLQGARDKAREWKRKLADGIDPVAEARQHQEAAEAERLETELQRQAEEEAARNRKSLKDLLDTYEQEVLKHHKRGAATRRALDGEMGLLKDFIDRDPASLKRSEIVLVLKQRAKVAPLSANRQLAYASAFFNWCVDEELLTANPVEKVKKPSKENVRDRHHSLAELREIWTATAKLDYPFKQLYRLLIVLPMRREEIAGMPVDELDLASDNSSGDGIWTLPSGRTKRANALRIPLSALAGTIIGEAIAHLDRPKDSPFVFSTTGKTSVSGFSKAKKRLDAEIQAARAKSAAEQNTQPVAMPHWTLHDLRTTFNTLTCDVLGVDANVADRILNHVATATTSKVMRIYNRAELFEPRKQALNAWAELLERKVIQNGIAQTPATALAA
jgi:integrase